jgi:two-component system sensor histidine kinase AlgZ
MRGPTPSRASAFGPGCIQFPDFRNLGTLLRTILLAEMASIIYHLAEQGGLPDALLVMGSRIPLYETSLLTTLLALFLISPWLGGYSFWSGTRISIVLSSLVAMAVHGLFTQIAPDTFNHGPLLSGALAALIATLIFFYFHWRQLALSPALSEARLMALQARIRPHFLFNSLNTVLGLIRPDPKQAESMLENLADLFRALLADPRTLVPLERELELAKAYVEVESIRLGERLRVGWHCESVSMQAMVPQLILQPLIENAVTHGIEPNAEGGEVHINIFMKGGRMVIVVRNPLLAVSPPRPGNRMALANIRERLDLHFDAEARMTHFTAGGEFVVQIEIPLRIALGNH